MITRMKYNVFTKSYQIAIDKDDLGDCFLKQEKKCTTLNGEDFVWMISKYSYLEVQTLITLGTEFDISRDHKEELKRFQNATSNYI